MLEFISALAEAEALHDFLEPIEEYPSSAFDYSEQYFADNIYFATTSTSTFNSN